MLRIRSLSIKGREDETSQHRYTVRMARPLPSARDVAHILATKRTRPAGRPPPAAARSLGKTLKALDARFGQGVEGLKARWTEIAGQTVARRTEPNKLITPRGGAGATLELRVAGPAATLVQHQAPDIIARVNLFLGPGAVVKLRIVQGPLRGLPAREAAVTSAARRRPKGPLDAAAEQRLSEDLAGFPEGRLKQALARLGREVIRAEHSKLAPGP
jgi:hypothetical protein